MELDQACHQLDHRPRIVLGVDQHMHLVSGGHEQDVGQDAGQHAAESKQGQDQNIDDGPTQTHAAQALNSLGLEDVHGDSIGQTADDSGQQANDAQGNRNPGEHLHQRSDEAQRTELAFDNDLIHSVPPLGSLIIHRFRFGTFGYALGGMRSSPAVPGDDLIPHPVPAIIFAREFMNTEFFYIIVATVLALVLLMVWVLVALPQKRARSTQQEVLGQLKVGDEVVTVGGMIGRLTYLNRDEDIARLEIAKGTEIRIIPSAISHPLDIMNRIKQAERQGGSRPAKANKA